MMRRREFITLLGGAAAAWPLAAQAQQPQPTRRIGVLLITTEYDADARPRLAAFRQRLQQLGWTEGRDLQIDTRFGPVDRDLRKLAAELVDLKPDALLAQGGTAVGALQQTTRSVPIVFAEVTDPVGVGLVESLARPSGNATGFSQFGYDFAVKWLELLKQIAPGVTRVAALRDPAQFAGGGQLGAIQAVAPLLGVEVTPLDVRETAVIERSIATFARGANGGLIVLSSIPADNYRETIIGLAARHRLPAVYFKREFAAAGGLMSYGADNIDQYPLAADYVDRILKGEKPANLPVQAPTKYELVINAKTAKALGLTVPPTMLTLADEVIE